MRLLPPRTCSNLPALPLIADIADCNYTFVIGENPNPEGKYSAKFIIRDTTDTKFYAPGESVAVPDAGADFIGWANVATGKVEDVTNLTMGESNMTYKAVYSTDTLTLPLTSTAVMLTARPPRP